MRKLLIKLIQILDGTPAVYGKRQSGQSVVELALITPILIILLAGLVEIGWFANNYLNLLDVTRAGARRGAVLQDQKSPLFWDNKYTYVPNALLPPQFQMPNTTAGDAAVNGTDDERFYYRWMPANSTVPGNTGEQACNTNIISTRPFYDEVICTMITTMDPLVLNQENGIDDIIVSGFAVQTIDPTLTTNPNWWLAPYPLRPINANVPQAVVVGRYPTNANECDVTQVNGTAVLQPDSTEGRDPFDINFNHHQDVQPATGDVIDGNNDFTELSGYDYPTPLDVAHAEKQIGFSLFGNHKIPGTYCVGSEWTMRDVENLMNLPNYDLTNNTQRDYLPGQGLILVEMYWEHEMLLKIPLLSPVYTAVGNSDGKMVINVWAAFPLASVEPHILFPCPPPTGTTLQGCS